MSRHRRRFRHRQADVAAAVAAAVVPQFKPQCLVGGVNKDMTYTGLRIAAFHCLRRSQRVGLHGDARVRRHRAVCLSGVDDAVQVHTAKRRRPAVATDWAHHILIHSPS